MNLGQKLRSMSQVAAETRSTYHYDKILKRANDAASCGRFKIIYVVDGNEKLPDSLIKRLKSEGLCINETGYDEDLDDDETEYTITW